MTVIYYYAGEAVFYILSSYNVPKLRYKTPDYKYKNFCYTTQNHSSVILLIIYVYQCLMNIFTKFYLPSMFQKLSNGSLIKMCTASHKITMT